MYPNPHILQHAGIYLKELPDNGSHLEIYELRPDLLIAWSVVERIPDGLYTLDMRGHWAVSAERLSFYLINDDAGEMYQEHYQWDGSQWRSEHSPMVILKKRNGPQDIKDNLYFDTR